MSVPPDKLHQRQVYDPFFVWKGTWLGTNNYQFGDVVVLSSNVYLCITANLNQTPPNTTYWQPLAAATPPPTPATTLPGSPANLQQAIYVDSTSTPTYVWYCQYSTTASAWLCTGSPISAVASATLTLPRAGTYKVWITGNLNDVGNGPTNVQATATCSSGTVTGRNVLQDWYQTGVGGTFGEVGDFGAQFVLTGCSASTTISWTGTTPTGGVIQAVPVTIT